MTAFVFGLFVIAEVTLAVIITLILAFAATGHFPKVAVKRIIHMWPVPLKKVQPNWENRCRSCGAVMQNPQRCPSCGLTRGQALDKNVLNYLIVNDGAISRPLAITELHTSETELDESLKRLSASGKITSYQATKTPERYTS